MADEYLLEGSIALCDVDGYGGPICERCLELDEPPWWPNNRQREALCLQRARLLPELLRVRHAIAMNIATFLAENDP